MFRTILLTLSITSLALYNTSANANPNKPCGGKIKVLIKDVQLTSEQREIFSDIKDTRRNWKTEHSSEPSQGKNQWMVDYLNGDLRQNELHDKIDDKTQKKFQLHQQMQPQIFDLLDTYSEVQREQVLSNIEAKNQCLETHKNNNKEHQEKISVSIAKALLRI